MERVFKKYSYISQIYPPPLPLLISISPINVMYARTIAGLSFACVAFKKEATSRMYFLPFRSYNYKEEYRSDPILANQDFFFNLASDDSVNKKVLFFGKSCLARSTE